MSPFPGAVVLWFLSWGVALGTFILVLRAFLRFVRAQERIASALEQIAAKQ